MYVIIANTGFAVHKTSYNTQHNLPYNLATLLQVPNVRTASPLP
jgi:hypothetical protein